MSDHSPEPDDQRREVPWWESGRPPEQYTLPKTRRSKIALITAIVVVTALLGLVIWGIVTGAASMGSMPM